MRRIAPILVLLLVIPAAGAQELDGGMSSGSSTSRSSASATFSDGISVTGSSLGGPDSTSPLVYSMSPSGLLQSPTSISPDLINQIPVSRIGYVDLVNLPTDTPGYNLDLNGFTGAPVAIGTGISIWPDFAIGGQPDLPRFDMLDPLKKIVGPERAGGAILGIFGNVNYSSGMVPPAIDFLRKDKTQNAFARSCQSAVDALLPFKGQDYSSCKSATSADYGQCRAALRSYVQSCLAFAETREDAMRRPDAPPTLPSEILDRMKAVSGILFYVADDPADSRIYCSAVRISKSWLLTARHCGFWRDRKDQVERNTLHTSKIRFIPFEDPTKQLTVIKPIDPEKTNPYTYIENDTSNDYMFFQIDGEQSDSVVPVEAPRAGERLVLFSFAVTALMDSNPGQAVSDDQLVREGAWIKYMAYDSSRTCLVGAMPRPNCLAYACQAEFVSSGGPLFRISDNDVALVGVHVGHIDPSTGDSCANPQLLGLVNRGVAPRTDDLKRLANLD